MFCHCARQSYVLVHARIRQQNCRGEEVSKTSLEERAALVTRASELVQTVIRLRAEGMDNEKRRSAEAFARMRASMADAEAYSRLFEKDRRA